MSQATELVFYLHDYGLLREVNECCYCDRKTNYEIKRQKAIKFIRINPEEHDFNISKVYQHIKNSSKRSWIDGILKRLLGLEFRSDHSIKLKTLKHLVNKILPDLWV